MIYSHSGVAKHRSASKSKEPQVKLLGDVPAESITFVNTMLVPTHTRAHAFNLPSGFISFVLKQYSIVYVPM